ncbi:MAG: GNAT family N-acetyltransferase [Pseudomonadota bacterium]
MILTARLALRQWRAGDLPSLDAILGDAEVMASSDHGPLSIAQQRDWLDRAIASAATRPLPGTLAITQASDGGIIGYVSLIQTPDRVGPREAEIGFRLMRRAWRQGYATEAGLAMIEAGQNVAGIDRIIAIFEPSNHASHRVLTKLGLRPVGEIMLEGYTHPDLVYAKDCGPA